MTDFGNGVSRVLDPNQAALLQTIWQEGKPPLDSELNLNQQIQGHSNQLAVLRGVPSGWLGNGTNMSESFVTNPIWSNWFRFGKQRANELGAIEWAAVNGWLVPVTGTMTGTPPGSPNDADTWNRLILDPPPSNSGDSRIDFVFLEVWQAKVAPNPSADNKPAASGLWRYGNVESGYTFLPDDLQDPELGFETTQRVQLQYRLRVVTGLVGLTTFPDGFDTTVVKAQGANSATTSFTFANMREALGDPGLWRAGDGTPNSLGTVDGYSYAVPLCAIFRRNVVAWDGDPSQNLNGSFNRNPTAIDRTGWTTFSTVPSLTAPITDAALSLTLSSVANISLPLTPASPVFIQVGDEVMTYSVITGTTMTLVSRGALGTRAESHLTGDDISGLPGRPDGLFSDQIAKTDVLDLRHAVSPNGFDNDTLLRGSLDRLLRGQLRSNWKRSGGGPQGSFVFYQDKISASAAALGVTLLDSPDGIRQIYSDAAVQQPVEMFLTPPVGQSNAETITTTWSLSLTATVDNDPGGAASQFNPLDVITIPVAQLKNGVSGADADQIRWLGTGNGLGAVVMRINGQEFPLRENFHYSVGAITDPADDLVVTLMADFPAATTEALVIKVHAMYGPGRGMSRRADSLHSIAFLSSGADIMSQLSGIPADNVPLRTAWLPLWSRFRQGQFNNLLPVTAEAYADPGSKTVVLTPFRRIELPNTQRTLDGTWRNVNTGTTVSSATDGSVSDASDVFTSGGADFVTDGVVAGDALVIAAGDNAGIYIVQSGGVAMTALTVNRATALGTFTFDTTEAAITYAVYNTQGLMPLDNLSGTAKWTTTDPLGLFSGTTDPTSTIKNIYLPIERNLMPGWSEVWVPIMHSDPTSIPTGGTSTFHQGINFGVLTKKGGTPGDSEKNFVPFDNGTLSYAPFSTLDLLPETPAVFNASFTFSGNTFAGMRFFSDLRGLGREGLELPPFYGVSRLFAVYEALDYKTNGSAFNPTTREPTGGGAVNLLRQDISDQPTMWVEIDADGDSTFILNAAVIDIDKSPNPIAAFASGQYVIEASVFGFDRGSFDLNQEFRMVLTRERTGTQAASGTRNENFGANPGTSAEIITPDLVVPAPPGASDEIAINFSRTPYQGDAWGSQTNQTDIGYKPGPLLTGTLFQLTSTELDEANLTRPNQKAIEVLSSVGFATTLGSGRLSGDFDPNEIFDFRTVGYEDLSSGFPPATAVEDRYFQKVPALEPEEASIDLGTSYHNCIERLPLGAIFRDKDFRGNFLNGLSSGDLNQFDSPLVFVKDMSPAVEGFGLATESSLEQNEVQINTPSQSSGQPGEILAHVDGEQGNYALLTNFRTNRGGSVFTINGPRPGGEAVAQLVSTAPSFTSPGVLSGVAYLVRNTVTSVGANEVSAGSELMMLIVTTGKRLGAVGEPLKIFLGTNGTGEGVSAADLYRIEGRPLLRDNVRVDIDPSTISLPKKRPADF